MAPAPSLPPDSRSLYQRAPCGLACTKDDGLFLVANDTLCHWVGLSSDELVGKMKFHELLTMGGRIFHQTHWSPLLRMQGSVSEVKLEVRHRDGSVIPMVMNALRRETAGAWVHEIAFIVARDRDAYERELVASRKKLQSLVEEATRLHAEAKDRALFAEQMVGIVSHDLKNPLSTIQMGTALLSRPAANQEAVLARIHRATERASRMITDLLDFTQARLGQGITIAVAPVDLRKCVAETVEELTLAYPGRAIVHEHEGGTMCHADCDRLTQVVGNLVSNAIAYGRPDAAVAVKTEVSEGLARLDVHNMGEPIPPDIQQTLFQPMVRGTVDAGSRSVGLGLYIVSEIARAHGGKVMLTSTAQEGTRFVVALPAADPADAPAAG